MTNHKYDNNNYDGRRMVILVSCVVLMLSGSSKMVEGFVGYTSNRLARPIGKSRINNNARLNMLVDPGNSDIVHQNAELLGSMFTASTAAAASDEWSFLWFKFGSHVDPYNTGKSLMPIDPDIDPATFRDYFLPTYSEKAANSAIAVQQKAIAGGATINPSDMTILSKDAPVTHPVDERELELIARSMDLVARKVPIAALLFATFDFFFIGANDVYKEDLEEEKPAVVADWITQSAARVLVAFIIGFGLITLDNITYHPIP